MLRKGLPPFVMFVLEYVFETQNGEFTGRPVFWPIRWNDLFGLLIFLPA
jgi:hypothetical protein